MAIRNRVKPVFPDRRWVRIEANKDRVKPVFLAELSLSHDLDLYQILQVQGQMPWLN